ncbi:serine/threonine transporter SstT [Acidaminococcus fermentans]|uniref:serine/threonine transporter SstT n=1 Tax=Acidaminococcus fermentans TaxID=905 RepID=UPI0008DF40AD|nr:serine/threonine transporter SstT [Acidaminococcus fermentans]MCF0139906.1 serine/threonine transporter SstT [Acidaminococcus fermentans]MDD7196513.1 serine/threonine transporter SstT [Acidaminococcus fermentans]MEE0338793.1 serine/threonine transporter SstT [Acidaminococcus fermentans]SFO77646.1 serine/threonine transporter [Acidaminococcus fermentans]
MNSMIRTLRKIPLIHQIAVGLIIGILIAVFLPGAVPVVGIFGDLFVRALKGVAPLLVFILVMNAMVQRKEGGDTQMKPIITLYVIGTFAASIVGVVLSFLFPQTLMLQLGNAKVNPPSGIAEVVHNLVLNIVDNPLNAILNANYIGILAWAVIIGLALHKAASPETKHVLEDLSAGITKVVTWVIHFAPLGIMGLVTQSISASGLSALISYFSLLGVLLGSYFLVALVMNPIIVYLNVRKNPYPLVWATIRESGIYAFFTRSSAANIPVNLTLCKRLGLNPDTYTISIPLGATINMAGASITISVLSLAAAHTLGVAVDLPTALLLCIVSTVGACGASGVAGGSLLLIPVACASFGISNDIAMQVVGVGFIISIIEDACETALNSSSDVLFTATAEYARRARMGTLKAEDMVPKELEEDE